MKKTLKFLYCLLVYAFLYAPIAVVIAYSFNDSRRSSLWHGFTWKWYSQLINDKALLVVASHSLIIAVISATMATILGSLIATALQRYDFFGKRSLYTVSFMMVISPDIVMAIALLMLYSFFLYP